MRLNSDWRRRNLARQALECVGFRGRNKRNSGRTPNSPIQRKIFGIFTFCLLPLRELFALLYLWFIDKLQLSLPLRLHLILMRVSSLTWAQSCAISFKSIVPDLMEENVSSHFSVSLCSCSNRGTCGKKASCHQSEMAAAPTLQREVLQEGCQKYAPVDSTDFWSLAKILLSVKKLKQWILGHLMLKRASPVTSVERVWREVL